MPGRVAQTTYGPFAGDCNGRQLMSGSHEDAQRQSAREISAVFRQPTRCRWPLGMGDPLNQESLDPKQTAAC